MNQCKSSFITPSKSLTKRASLNALASIIDYGARVLVEFVINPLLVAGLGNYLYGLWRILWRLNGYMDAAGGRSAQVLKWAVAKDQTLTNYVDKRRYVGGTVAVWFLFLPLLTMLGGGLVWLAPILLEVPEEFLLTTQLTIGLLALNVVLFGLVDIPKVVLQGENLGYKRMGLSALLVLAGGGLTVLAVIQGLGLVGVAAATVATTLISGMVFLGVVRRQVPWFGIARPTREITRRFYGLSGWFVLWKIVSQLMLAGDILILGIFDSVVLVTVYTLTKYVPETLIRLVGTVVFNISPGLGGIIGAGNLEKAVNVRGEIMAFTWLLLTVAGACILLWNQLFVQLWVGDSYYAGLIPTLLIILLVAQITFIRNDSNVIDLTLNIRIKVLIGVLAETLALSLAALLVSRYGMGIVGLCIGSIAGHSIISVVYPFLVGQVLGIRFYDQVKGALRPVIVTLLLLLMMLGIKHYGESYPQAAIFLERLHSWPGLVVGVAATAMVVSVLAFYGGLSSRQRRGLIKRLQAVIQR